jgi:hypothetical protein
MGVTMIAAARSNIDDLMIRAMTKKQNPTLVKTVKYDLFHRSGIIKPPYKITKS